MAVWRGCVESGGLGAALTQNSGTSERGRGRARNWEGYPGQDDVEGGPSSGYHLYILLEAHS